MAPGSGEPTLAGWPGRREIGRAACRGRGEISGGGGLLKKKKKPAALRGSPCRQQESPYGAYILTPLNHASRAAPVIHRFRTTGVLAYLYQCTMKHTHTRR